MEIDKQECSKCKGLFPDTLIPTDGICVYCKADAAEKVAAPKEPIPPKVRKQQSAQKRAEKEAVVAFCRKI